MTVMLVTALLPLFFFSAVLIWLQNNAWLFELPMFKVILITSFFSVLLIGLALTPSTVIAILCGYFLGWYGLIPVFISYPLAAALGLWVGRVILHFKGIPPFERLPAYRPYLHALKKHEWMMTAYMRLSPVMPFAMMNVFLASLPIRWFHYITGSMAGMLPRTLLFFWAGMNAREIWFLVREPTLDGAWRIFPALMVFVALFGLVYIFKRVLKEAALVEQKV